MSDPQTPTIAIYQPARGSDSGTWDLPHNANCGALDSLFGNVAVISLSNSNVTLSTPPNSGASWAGPYQSQSSLIRFTGMLTANVTVSIPRPGFYIVENLCTGTGTFSVTLTAGNFSVGAPPGKKCHVFNDGTNMDYVNMPDPGTAYDLHGVTALPPWMLACTILPYLIKDGATYSNSSYPALAAILGTTFGGTPGSTFSVPDERARARVGFDTGATGRLTSGQSGISGTTMGSSGGDQRNASHSHTASVSDAGHAHATQVFISGSNSGPVIADQASYQAGGATVPGGTGVQIAGTGIGVSIGTTGNGASQNVQPTIVSFLPLIKTAIFLGFLLGSLNNVLPGSSYYLG